MAEFRCESIEKYGDCAVDREQWCGEERPIQCSFCHYYKPIMTNSEKIRSMTDEELAEFMDNGCDVIAPSENCTKAFYDCKKCWLDWLKQEAEDEH